MILSRPFLGSICLAVASATMLIIWPSSIQTRAAGENNLIVRPVGEKSGAYPSLQLDANGNAVVSYRDNLALHLLHCGDSICSGAYNEQPVPSPSGLYSTLLLDSSAKPVISHVNSGELYLVHCGDPNCRDNNTSATVDTGYIVGNSLALDSAGNPVMSYWDESTHDLKLAHCDNASCTASSTITTLDVGNVAGGTSLQLDASDRPIIAYCTIGTINCAQVRLLLCEDQACSARNDVVVSDTGNVAGPKLILDDSGKPIVAYLDVASKKTKVLFCGNTSCTADNLTVVPIDEAGGSLSLALDHDNKLVVSYYATADRATGIKLLHCGDPTCAAGNSISIIDSTQQMGYGTSLAIDRENRPVVAYFDYYSWRLRLAFCSTPGCTKGALSPTPTYTPRPTATATSQASSPSPTATLTPTATSTPMHRPTSTPTPTPAPLLPMTGTSDQRPIDLQLLIVGALAAAAVAIAAAAGALVALRRS